jgi:aspartate 1-decarboxylase
MTRRRAPALRAGAAATPPGLPAGGQVQIVRAKLHGLRVTGADLDYHGSITLDPDHCDAVGIVPMEFVDVWNKHSGARLSTYVIHGERGSGCCILNGAAARTCQVGDAVIICASLTLPLAEAHVPRPRVAVFDASNRLSDLLEYRAGRLADGRSTFETVRLPGGGRRVRSPT